MSPSTNSIELLARPWSVLVIGCGLIGTSFALALQRVAPTLVIDGVDTNPIHRDGALQHGVFREIFADLSQTTAYDLAVLAVPVDVACTLLPTLNGTAQLVMDVCSVKEPICRMAAQLGLRASFVPTHPMAGLATQGPSEATADLFRNRPWLFIKDWPACEEIEPYVRAIGSRIEYVSTATEHDEAMAAVSHGIHVLSLVGMLAYGDAEDAQTGSLAALTGPGFRDVTRLSASSSSFWVSTLLSNRMAVEAQIERMVERLKQFQTILQVADTKSLADLLDAARAMNDKWRRELP